MIIHPVNPIKSLSQLYVLIYFIDNNIISIRILTLTIDTIGVSAIFFKCFEFWLIFGNVLELIFNLYPVCNQYCMRGMIIKIINTIYAFDRRLEHARVGIHFHSRVSGAADAEWKWHQWLHRLPRVTEVWHRWHNKYVHKWSEGV